MKGKKEKCIMLRIEFRGRYIFYLYRSMKERKIKTKWKKGNENR